MIIPSFNEIENITDSRYALVMLVSNRAREIINGSEPLIETDIVNPISLAIEEALEGAVSFATPEEAKEIKRQEEELKKIEEEKLLLLGETDKIVSKLENKGSSNAAE